MKKIVRDNDILCVDRSCRSPRYCVTVAVLVVRGMQFEQEALRLNVGKIVIGKDSPVRLRYAYYVLAVRFANTSQDIS